jgi:CHASE2 domain-containing sensor protein
VGEPISRWFALLVTLATLPIACAVVTIGLASGSSSLLGIGLGWLGVVGLLTITVQVAVAVLNREAARSSALPRAWTTRRAR